MAEDIVPFEGTHEDDEIGFKRQRHAVLELLKRVHGMKPGEAHTIFERLEHALDVAVQMSAPRGTIASEAMAAGFKAFLDGAG